MFPHGYPLPISPPSPLLSISTGSASSAFYGCRRSGSGPRYGKSDTNNKPSANNNSQEKTYTHTHIKRIAREMPSSCRTATEPGGRGGEGLGYVWNGSHAPCSTRGGCSDSKPISQVQKPASFPSASRRTRQRRGKNIKK